MSFSWVLESFIEYVFDPIYLLCQLSLDPYPLLYLPNFLSIFLKTLQDEFVLPKYSWACGLTLDLLYLPGTPVLEKNGLSVPQQLIIARSSTTKGVNLC